MREFIKNNRKVLLIAAAVVAVLFFAWHQLSAERQKVYMLTQEQLADREELRKVVNDSQRQARDLKAEIDRIKDGKVQPVYITTVQAPTSQEAARKVEDSIKKDDRITPDAPKLPPADKTIVTPNEQEHKVEVYRITLDRARLGANAIVLAGDGSAEVGVGPSWKNRDNAINLGYTTKQRYYGMWVRYF